MSINKNEFYPIVDHIPYEECVLLGIESGNVRFSSKVHALWTGEKRCPRKGEWYLSGAIIGAYRALNDLTTLFHIARLVPTEIKTMIVKRFVA